jgi:hypothetical protein
MPPPSSDCGAVRPAAAPLSPPATAATPLPARPHAVAPARPPGSPPPGPPVSPPGGMGAVCGGGGPGRGRCPRGGGPPRGPAAHASDAVSHAQQPHSEPLPRHGSLACSDTQRTARRTLPVEAPGAAVEALRLPRTHLLHVGRRVGPVAAAGAHGAAATSWPGGGRTAARALRAPEWGLRLSCRAGAAARHHGQPCMQPSLPGKQSADQPKPASPQTAPRAAAGRAPRGPRRRTAPPRPPAGPHAQHRAGGTGQPSAPPCGARPAPCAAAALALSPQQPAASHRRPARHRAPPAGARSWCRPRPPRGSRARSRQPGAPPRPR